MSHLFGESDVLADGVDVLVVEVDQHARTRIADALRVAGYSVETARDLEEAAIVMKLCEVRAMVLDVRVRDVEALSELAGLENPPAIILVSSYTLGHRVLRRVANVFVHNGNPDFSRHIVDTVCHEVKEMEKAELKRSR